MRHQTYPRILALGVLFATVLLAGCGGGLRGLPPNDPSTGSVLVDCNFNPDPNQGCANPNTSTPQDNSSNTSDTITESNAPAILNAALTAVEQTYYIGQSEGVVISSGVETATLEPSLGAFLKEFLTALNDPVAEQGVTLPVVLGAVAVPLVIHCREGDIRPDSQDTTRILFNVASTCTLSSGTAFQGTITISEFSLDGTVSDSTNWSMSSLFSFASFSITLGTTTLGVTGDLRFTAQKVATKEDGKLKVEKTVGITNGGQTTSLNTDFGVDYSYNYGTKTLTLDPFGTFSSSNFSGLQRITVSSGSTPNPLVQEQADAGNYSAGTLLVATSNGSSSAQLNVQSSNALDITVGGTSIPIADWATLRATTF